MATRTASREPMIERATGRPVKDETLVLRLSELRARISSNVGAAKRPMMRSAETALDRFLGSSAGDSRPG